MTPKIKITQAEAMRLLGIGSKPRFKKIAKLHGFTPYAGTRGDEWCMEDIIKKYNMNKEQVIRKLKTA